MEKVLLEFNLFLFLIFSYKKIRHGLHILQLENYYNDRYLAWMLKNIKTVLDIKVIGLLAISAIVSFINLKIGLIINFCIDFFYKKEKRKKSFCSYSKD